MLLISVIVSKTTNTSRRACFTNPSLALNILPSRSLSPSLSFYEHAILTPTPPPLPPDEQGSVSSYEINLYDAPKSEYMSKHFNIKYGKTLNKLRHKKEYLTNGRIIGSKQFSEEARKRYEAYRQQWQKFRFTQWDQNDVKSMTSSDTKNINSPSLKGKPSLVTKESSSVGSSRQSSQASLSLSTSKPSTSKLDLPSSTMSHDSNT